jgi:hypothetical protein
MSGWISRRFSELRGMHLLEFVFMIAKFGTVSRPLIVKKVWQAGFVPLGAKVLATLISVTPRILLRVVSGVRGIFVAD